MKKMRIPIDTMLPEHSVAKQRIPHVIHAEQVLRIEELMYSRFHFIPSCNPRRLAHK